MARSVLRLWALPVVAGFLIAGTSAPAGAAPAPARSPVAATAFGPLLAEDIFSALACPTAKACLAVGDATLSGQFDGAAAASWDGSAWHASAPAVPSDAAPQSPSFLGASCPAASRCVAVGEYDTNQTESHVLPIAELWNGSGWQLLNTRFPSSDDHLGGVSCVGASDCIAVGGDRGFGGSHLPLAEIWHGGAWATMTTPSPGATDYDTKFDSVSCTAANWCMAVGVYDNTSHALFTLAETWNGKQWRQVTAPGTGLTSVSCASPSSCLAVSGSTVQEWNGTSWRVIAQSASGGPTFSNVTCPSVSDCLVVGGTGSAPLAQTWNGSTFHQTPVPSPDPGAALAAASCTAAAHCVAVGTTPATYSDNLFAMAAYWQGTSWRVARIGRVDGLNWVSCPQITACVAVGGYLDPGDTQVALGEQEQQGAWRAMAPQPPSSGFSELASVSCTSPADCMAVGDQVGDRWNGKTWQRTHLPVAVGPVSCVAADCVALGNQAAAVWNGTSWRKSPAIIPKGSNATDLGNLSCPSSHWCMTAGQYFTDPHDSNGIDLAEVWNGTSWRMLKPPEPGQNNTLVAVSCTSTTHCVVVGLFNNSTNVYHSFAAVWNGHSWKSYSIAGPNRILLSVSCTAATRCLAVGDSTPASGNPFSPSQPIAQSWSGGTWKAVTVGIHDAAFNNVACTSPQACVAVGSRADGQTLAARWNGSAWSAMTTANP